MSFFDFLLDADARKVAAEARELARTEVDPEYLKAMDRDEVKFPREIYQKYADRGLLGVRFPRECGGRGLNWISAIAALNAGVRHEKMLDDEGMWLAQWGPSMPHITMSGFRRFRWQIGYGWHLIVQCVATLAIIAGSGASPSWRDPEASERRSHQHG